MTMGSKWFTGGVSAAPRERIQFDFVFDGVRYRPTIQRPPSESNLRRARERLEAIKQQIEVGTFSFVEEFPDYRFSAGLLASLQFGRAIRYSTISWSTANHAWRRTIWRP
jgi:integrase